MWWQSEESTASGGRGRTSNACEELWAVLLLVLHSFTRHHSLLLLLLLHCIRAAPMTSISVILDDFASAWTYSAGWVQRDGVAKPFPSGNVAAGRYVDSSYHSTVEQNATASLLFAGSSSLARRRPSDSSPRTPKRNIFIGLWQRRSWLGLLHGPVGR